MADLTKCSTKFLVNMMQSKLVSVDRKAINKILNTRPATEVFNAYREWQDRQQTRQESQDRE